MSCRNIRPIGDFIDFSRGGGWGKEVPFDGATKVAIVRGADFPDIERGFYRGLPVRYEKASKVASVQLRVGDIILENSGGTDNRPTGRTVLITRALLDSYDCPVIPASFCRLLRFKSSVDSSFAYFWLQGMYRAGRTWGYQNRSTGLSNFQFKVFTVEEMMPDLPFDEQRKTAVLLSCLNQKITLNNRTNDYLAA